MAIETLNIPEEHLEQVIEVIRIGLKTVKVDTACGYALLKWCNEEELYLEKGKNNDNRNNARNP